MDIADGLTTLPTSSTSTSTLLSALPVESLVRIARFLPTASILTLSQASRSLRGILSHRAIWTHVDLSPLGAKVTDRSFERFTLLVAKWIADPPTYGTLEAIIRSVVLDGTAVTRRTALKVMQYPFVRNVSLRGCRGVSRSDIDVVLSRVAERSIERDHALAFSDVSEVSDVEDCMVLWWD